MRRFPHGAPLLAAALRGAIADDARRARARQRLAIVETLDCERVSSALLLAALNEADLAAIQRLRERRARLTPASSPREIAAYMLHSVRDDGCLYRDVLLADLRQRCASRYLLETARGGTAVHPAVLRAFRRLAAGTVRWDPSQQYWRSAQRSLDASTQAPPAWPRPGERSPLPMVRVAG
ncbi:MAG: DUF6953 family protein [Dehalococcoidia bacterium]